jgi:hypothetical protein
MALTLAAGQRASEPAPPPPGTSASPSQDPPATGKRLRMTPAVACKSVTGYQQYVPLNEPAVTKDDKLLVYYEVEDFAVESSDTMYKVHLTQDVRLRHRGRKPVLWSKDKILDYEGKSPQPLFGVYLANTIGLKQLKPGEYDLDIVLHDLIGKGPPAEQVLRFEVKASATSVPVPEEKEKESERAGSRPR